MGEAVMTSEGGDNQSLKKFLPKMVLRVLLVEADDCTRQIIAALLRKCSYRVAAVSDGLKAWETLKERHHNIDLVLTEVDLPSISGYALLSLIVEHDMCKNIPVIMMSSTDSISTVLKCMVKGASDFLIKPVRKNELRNLWQHVWRKKIGQQNAGSRRPQNNVLENQKHVDISENDAESNYSSDNLASVQGGNDKASDAQVVTGSSCRDDSNMRNDERHEECVEMVERSFMPKSKQLENVTSSGMGTSSGARPYSSADISSEEGRLFAEPRPMSTEVQQELRGKDTCTVEEVDFQLNELYSAPCTEAFDLIGKFESSLGDYASHSYDSKDKSNVASRLELSMRTFNPSCPNGEGSIEQNMLSNSKASAFSKYENKKTLQPLYSDWTSNFAALKDGPSSSTWEHDAPLTESQQNATALVMCQPGNHEAAVSGTQLNFNPVDMLSFGSTVANHTHLHPSMSHTESDCDQVQTPKSQSPLPTSSLTYSSSEVHIPEHRMQPCDDTTINSEDNVAEADNGKLITVEKARYDSATCGSSDFGSGVTNKLSSSRSGSNSNEATESSFSVASPGRAPVSENVNYNDILHDKTKGESHNTSQREAALAKFRLKRKDRCFEKKVRYQSRKRLAEQRPRVKGQFVRQLQNETQPMMDNDKT